MAVVFTFSACKSEEQVVPQNFEDEDEAVEELQSKVDELKDEVVEDDEESKNEDEKDIEESEEKEVVKEETKDVEKEVEKAPKYTGESFISLSSPKSEETFSEVPIIFKGTVSPNTTKIVVNGTGGTKDEACDGICFPYYNDTYTLKDFNLGDKTFVYRAKEDWKNLTMGSNDYTFTAYFENGTSSSVKLKIYYTPGGAEMGKPVIYLYPEKTSAISVNVEPTGGISISEPELKDGWNVIATPESAIYNIADRTVYPYLFWEGFATNFETPKEGFVIPVSEVERFFDAKLAVLGLNKKEISDFKEFWVPLLSEKPYYFITFVPQKTFDEYAPLTVTPTPDSVIRVFFDYKGLDKTIRVKEQKLITPERNGFTVVEWGGRLY